MVLGLDMRFLGGNRDKKIKTKSKGNRFSRFALRASLRRYTPMSKNARRGPRLRQSGRGFGPAFFGTSRALPIQEGSREDVLVGEESTVLWLGGRL